MNNITIEKMLFLTANYGLSAEQVASFWNAYLTTYYQQAGEIEYAWEESGYFPEDPESAMIEVLVDADRLMDAMPAVSYTHLTLPTNREV